MDAVRLDVLCSTTCAATIPALERLAASSRSTSSSRHADAQVNGPDLHELAAGAPPRQGQRGVLAAGDHQMQRRWQVLEQEGHRVVHRRGAHEVVVVQDQDTEAGRAARSLTRR